MRRYNRGLGDVAGNEKNDSGVSNLVKIKCFKVLVFHWETFKDVHNSGLYLKYIPLLLTT